MCVLGVFPPVLYDARLCSDHLGRILGTGPRLATLTSCFYFAQTHLSLVNNQMTIRAAGLSGFSAAATVIHADKLQIQCSSSALLQSPIHVEVAEPVYLQFFSLSDSDEWISL